MRKENFRILVKRSELYDDNQVNYIAYLNVPIAIFKNIRNGGENYYRSFVKTYILKDADHWTIYPNKPNIWAKYVRG